VSYLRRPLGAIAVPSRARTAIAVPGLGSTQSRPASHQRVLGTLGDDTPSIDATQTQWQQDLLATAKESRDWQARWVKKDETQRWIQIGATVCIPLFAALWRGIFGRRA